MHCYRLVYAVLISSEPVPPESVCFTPASGANRYNRSFAITAGG